MCVIRLFLYSVRSFVQIAVHMSSYTPRILLRYICTRRGTFVNNGTFIAASSYKNHEYIAPAASALISVIAMVFTVEVICCCCCYSRRLYIYY